MMKRKLVRPKGLGGNSIGNGASAPKSNCQRRSAKVLPDSVRRMLAISGCGGGKESKLRKRN